MRVPVYLVCAALAVVVRGEERTNNNYNYNNNNGDRFLEPFDAAADRETVSYLLPKLAAKYRPNSDWSGVTDPRFYVLTEMEENNEIDDPVAQKNVQRRSPSISIVAPMDVLRKTWQQERARKQAEVNREFLNRLT